MFDSVNGGQEDPAHPVTKGLPVAQKLPVDSRRRGPVNYSGASNY